jgi:hypothetical protein
MEFFGVVWFGLVAMMANLIWLHSFESSAKPGSRPIVSERIAKCGRTGALVRVDSLLITGRTGGRVRNSFGGGWPGNSRREVRSQVPSVRNDPLARLLSQDRILKGRYQTVCRSQAVYQNLPELI